MSTASSVCKTVLPNGLRVLTEQVPYVDSISIGLWAMAGSRDEADNQRGISHLIEHMLFKGTSNRTARQIAYEMDYLGGHLNAFTDKEFTCYYVKVLREHTGKALDVLSDMTLNSLIETEELEREKNVVSEEIGRHQDTPEELVHDLLPGILWQGHRLGNSVIGDADVIKAMTRQELVAFVNGFYTPDAIVISAAGNVKHSDFVDIVSERFGGLSGSRQSRVFTATPEFVGKQIVNRSTEQVHFCLGTTGYKQNDIRKYALATVDCVLGGGMSSRLFQEIRESRGLAYSIGSYSVAHAEAGMFVVYGGAGAENVGQVLELVESECADIGKNSITDEELERAKNQIRGALVLGQESMSNRMSRLAKSEIYFQRMIMIEEIVSAITKVSKDDVAAVASDLLHRSRFALAAIGPFEEHPECLNGVVAAE